MKKRISLFICVFLIVLGAFAFGVNAETFYPDSYGTYTVSLSVDANNEYILFVLKGEYDQTNYIEAFNAASDEDILYFEQGISDKEGNISFGPFAPFGYYDATLILGGSGMDEPYFAGSLSAKGVSNSASISISGVEQKYTVEGVNGNDIVIDIETEVFDSFGFPSVTGEEVVLSLAGNDDTVTIEGNTLTISKIASEQTFSINACAGDASKSVFVDVKRMASAPSYIEVYTDADCTNSVEDVSVIGVPGKTDAITLYAKTFDQYKAEVDETYSYFYGSKVSTSTITPMIGIVDFTVTGRSSNITKTIKIIATARPDYSGYALELYNLIESSKAKLLEEKTVSEEQGRDVFPEEKWIAQTDVTAFEEAVKAAEEALALYGSESNMDGDYADEVKALSDANSAYDGAFKNGVRVDLKEISFVEHNTRVTVGTSFTLITRTTPSIYLTTDRIVWTSSDENIATVDINGKVVTKTCGTVTITAETRSGLKAETEIVVFKNATRIELTPNMVTAEYGAEPVSLKALVYPLDHTDEIIWSVDNPEIADISISKDGSYEVCTVIPKSAGTTTVRVTAVEGNKSVKGTISVVMPDWETVATPKVNPGSGMIVSGTPVSITTDTPDAVIYYTLDGTTPSAKNGRVYKNPIEIRQTLTLKAIAVCDKMFDSEVVTCNYIATDAEVKVSKASSTSAGEVTVDVDAKDFTNVKNATIVLNYDSSVLNFKLGVMTEKANVSGEAGEDGKYTITFVGNAGLDYSGNLATLTFDISENAPEGDYPIEVVEAEITTFDGLVYQASTVNGNVNVNNYILGDADDNGKISLADVLLIKQYLAGNELAADKIVLGAADVDGDGDVDGDDVLLLSKHCVGWNVLSL